MEFRRENPIGDVVVCRIDGTRVDEATWTREFRAWFGLVPSPDIDRLAAMPAIEEVQHADGSVDVLRDDRRKLMPESPDFDQIARRLLDVVLEDVEGLDMMSAAQEGWSERVIAQIAEQLRQIWNARGAVDIAKVEHELSTMMGSTMAGPYCKNLDRALRALDR
jgi:hypothetical protein